MKTESKKLEVINYDKLFIGGKWIAPSTKEIIEIRFPHDQSLTGTTVAAGTADVDLAVATAKKTFEEGEWPKYTLQQRQAIIRKFDELQAEQAEHLAALTTAENGTPNWFTNATLTYVRLQTDSFLRASNEFPFEVHKTTGAGQKAVLRNEPIGVVAIVIPWNAPQQTSLAKIVPALLAGNTVVFKPSPETALDGIALGDLFMKAGLPEGVLSILPAGREVSEYLVSHPDVDKIAFTGSSRAGRTIGSIAGDHLKRFSLELGGKSAAIILDDADLLTVVGGLTYGSFGNNGESCVAQTRILAPESRYEEFVEALGKMVATLKVGNPANEDTFIGPMVNKTQWERVKGYINLGIEEGARVVVGGAGLPDGEGLENGFYVKPTLFADVNNKMRIAREEIFGPVVVVMSYKDEEEAIAIANDSEYGLSGSVYTNDADRGLEIARRIKTGTFSINGSKFDFDMPFGGYKNSGIGREFGAAGMHEYVQQKSIIL